MYDVQVCHRRGIMKRAAWVVAILTVLASGRGWAEELAFTSSIDVAASCNEVWTNLTEFARLQKLVPCRWGTSFCSRANSVRFVQTSLQLAATSMLEVNASSSAHPLPLARTVKIATTHAALFMIPLL